MVLVCRVVQYATTDFLIYTGTGNPELLDFVMDPIGGLPQDFPSPTKNYMFRSACNRGRLDLVRFIFEKLKLGRVGIDLMRGGWSAIKRAASNGHFDIIRYLVETVGVRPSLKGMRYNSYSSSNWVRKYPEIASYLVANAVETESESTRGAGGAAGGASPMDFSSS